MFRKSQHHVVTLAFTYYKYNAVGYDNVNKKDNWKKDILPHLTY